MRKSPEKYVQRVARCTLAVTAQQWPFAATHAARIDAHWARRRTENPAMFNGVVHLLTALDIEAGACVAHFVRTDFKSYLTWREQGYPAAGVRDGFGSALIRSVEGHVLLGRQRAGNLNSGQAYPPGGFIDARDVDPDGIIDIEASIAREMAEETGLDPATLECAGGYLVTFAGPLLSIAAEYRSRLPADELRARILRHIAADPQSELVDAVIVRTGADLARIDMPEYARVLLGWLLAAPS